jgi:hypothetical protein
MSEPAAVGDVGTPHLPALRDRVLVDAIDAINAINAIPVANAATKVADTRTQRTNPWR